jgi:hypothetical protein
LDGMESGIQILGVRKAGMPPLFLAEDKTPKSGGMPAFPTPRSPEYLFFRRVPLDRE